VENFSKKSLVKSIFTKNSDKRSALEQALKILVCLKRIF